MASSQFRYSRWDGTQVGFDLDADAVLEQITDDLLYHGDLNAALRRLLQSGFRTGRGRTSRASATCSTSCASKRQERLDRFDLGGVYDEIAEELREVVEAERDALDRQVSEAAASGDERREETARASADERNMRLEMLPPDLAGMVRDLERYDFTSRRGRSSASTSWSSGCASRCWSRTSTA